MGTLAGVAASAGATIVLKPSPNGAQRAA